MHGTLPRTNNDKNFKVLQMSPNPKRETNILQKSDINVEGIRGAALLSPLPLAWTCKISKFEMKLYLPKPNCLHIYDSI